MHTLTSCAVPVATTSLHPSPLPHIAAANRILENAHKPDFDKDLGWNADDNGNTAAHLLLLAALAEYEKGDVILSLPACKFQTQHPLRNERKTASFEKGEVTLTGQNVEYHFAFGTFSQLIWAGFDPSKEYPWHNPLKNDSELQPSFFDLAARHIEKPGVFELLKQTVDICLEYQSKSKETHNDKK